MNFDFLLESIKPTQTSTITIDAAGALVFPAGNTANRPAGVRAGSMRWNTDIAGMETYNGSAWVGTVTSVAVSGSTGLTVGGSPITTAGTITLTLGTELQGLSGLAANGLITRTSAGTYTSRTLAGTANRITVTNGDGVAGAPTIDLATVTDSGAGTFKKVTVDSYGRVTGTQAVGSADIATVLGYTPINKAGDTGIGALTLIPGSSITLSGNGTVTGLPPVPISSTDAVSKAYVDSIAQGLDPKGSVRAATTGPVSLSSIYTGKAVDGVTLITGDRVLIKNQAASAENGIYTISSGAPVRAADMNAWTEVPGAFVFVEEGSTQADTSWVCTSNQGGTIDATGITFVQFGGAGTYTAGTGLTLTGTTFSITSPIATTLGGTGLSSIGTANQILGVNAGATGLEYKTVTAGTGVSVTQAAGSLTIANTGVTSVALSLPSIFTVSGSPVTTTGTLSATLASQTANTVFVAPNGSAGAPTFRTLAYADLPIKLYAENVGTFTAPIASAANSIASGNAAVARRTGHAFANGRFSTPGDAQNSVSVLRNLTTTAATTELFLDGGTERWTLAENSSVTFRIDVVARRTDATGGNAAYTFTGMAKRDSGVNTTAMVGSVSKTVIVESNPVWDATVSASADGTGSLRVIVSGEDGKTVRWVATVYATEVTN